VLLLKHLKNPREIEKISDDDTKKMMLKKEKKKTKQTQVNLRILD